MIPDENVVLDRKSLSSIDDGHHAEREDLKEPTPQARPISSDTVSKLIDSGRGEIRAYRALYFALFGVGLFAAAPIAAVYRDTGAASGPAWITGSVISWAVGSLLILFGGYRMLPAFHYGNDVPNESATNIAIDTAVREPNGIAAQHYLVRALDAIHETQERVVVSGRFVITGIGFVFVAIAVALIRWIVVWQEVKR